MESVMPYVEQIEILNTVKEGDIFELGSLLKVPGSKPDDIVWQVAEAADTKKGRRITFRLTFMNVPLGNMIAVLKGQKVDWTGALIQ